MSTTLIRPEAVATIDGEDYAVRPGSRVTLDSGAVPYATAELVLPLLSDESLEWLDPDVGVRIPLEANTGGTPRSFDLGLSGRKVDHRAKTVTLRLASDEVLALRYKSLTTDTGARAHQASARAVTNYVLGKIGASLEAGADDADVTAYWPLTNLHPNPSCAANVTGYLSGGGCTIAWNSATGASGTGFCRATMTGTSGAVYLSSGATVGYAVSPGDPVALSVAARHSAAGASMSVSLRYLNSDNAVIKTDTSALASVPTAWGTRFSHISKAPDGAAKVVPFVSVAGSANTRNWDIDAVCLVKDTEVPVYFDGGVAPTGYTTAWQDTANASQSTRTPIVERLPELFVWLPGTSAWDFLQGILSAAGLVLWCDELRDWRLALPANRVIEAQVNVNSFNGSDGTDELSMDDTEARVSGVVVRYQWRDAAGIQRTAYDAAGTPENAIRIDLDRAYPGPGAAAAILARRQGTGRVQEVTAITRYNTTPGMSAQISLPGAPDTLGRVTAVTFWLATGFMDLGTAGLIDVNAGDWLALAADLDWEDVDAAMDWEDA